MHAPVALWGIVAFVVLGLGVACGPAPAQPAAPAPQAAPKAAAPAEPAKPAAAAQPAKPAAQPAEPAAQPAKPAAQPAKPAASAELKRMLLAGPPSGSSQYAYWAAVTKVINADVPNVNVTLVESGATVEHINRLAKGDFDLVNIGVDPAFLATRGLEQWKDKPVSNIRWLWMQRAAPIAVVVREDSRVKKLADLDGKDFNAGIPRSTTEKTVKDAITALGIKPRYYVGDTAEAVQAIKNRQIVGYGKTLAGLDQLDASIIDLMTAAKVRVVPFTEEESKKVLEAYPYYSFMRIPAGLFKDVEWNKEPILTIGLAMGAAAATKMPEDLASAIVKAIDEDNMPNGKKIQAGALKAIANTDFGKLTVEGEMFTVPPLHAGAYKWFKERGLKIPDVIIPPEAKR